MTDHSFNHNDYEIIERKALYQGIFRLAFYRIRHRLFDGKWSETLNREILERRPAAAVLPYDPLLDKVVLIEQFRTGALAHPTSPWLIEIVAGILEKDEQPIEVALRETHEEAGCNISHLELISDFFVSPGASNEYLYIFCGKVDATNISGIHGLASEHEDIRVFTVSSDEAFEMLRQNQIKTCPAVVALHWLEVNRDTLRKKWLK